MHPTLLIPLIITRANTKLFLTLLLMIGLMSLSAQAATIGNANPTADLQLINLQGGSVSVEDWSDVDEMLAVADETDDDIDAISDVTAIDLSDEIPQQVAQVSLNAISPETLKTFVAVVDLVRREYVESVNDEELFSNAMSGMLTKLDSHAEFLDAEAYENLRAFTQGDVGDVGLKAQYQPIEGYWVITQVIEDSSADKKGIEIGDYLHQVGEFKLNEDRQSNDVAQLLTGIAGSQIEVVISKAGRRKQAMTLQRNNSSPQTIETRLIDGLVIIKLPAFQDNSREQILKSITSLNAPVSGVLLDLRDNPGGVLTSAVQVASLFMDNKKVVQVIARQSEPQTLMTQGKAILKPLPVVILQNRYSASAAEVLASSLQTQDRATIVGETSYGKGSVQSVISLNDQQAVKLTVAHYVTADGRDIENIGVQPDATLFGNERTWEQQALDILRQQVSSTGIRFINKDSEEGAIYQSTHLDDDNKTKP